jgi:hypothetical protein
MLPSPAFVVGDPISDDGPIATKGQFAESRDCGGCRHQWILSNDVPLNLNTPFPANHSAPLRSV